MAPVWLAALRGSRNRLGGFSNLLNVTPDGQAVSFPEASIIGCLPFFTSLRGQLERRQAGFYAPGRGDEDGSLAKLLMACGVFFCDTGEFRAMAVG